MNALIFGCGYLGHQVAQLWRGTKNKVYAVTRSPAKANTLRSENLIPIVADVTRPETLGNLPDVDAVLFAVGFDRKKYSDIRDVYVTGLKHVLANLNANNGHLIYISSTGVFGNCDGQWVDENSAVNPARPGAKACLEAESMIANSPFSDRSTVLRLAGIYGPNRVPRLDAIEQQDWSSLSPSGHINLIHVLDAAHVVDSVFKKRLTGETFLVSDGRPTLRKDFYEYVAEQMGAGPIDWSIITSDDVASRAKADKKIGNRKLLDMTGCQFMFPDYRAGVLDALKTKI